MLSDDLDVGHPSGRRQPGRLGFFTYENATTRALINEAQARSQAKVTDRVEAMTTQQEASWRERALNAEDQLRGIRRELRTQRRLVADLMGQLRQPDGTWIEDDRNRLREQNEQLLAERDRLAKERNELQRRLEGARANIAHLNSDRVTELFPDRAADNTGQRQRT